MASCMEGCIDLARPRTASIVSSDDVRRQAKFTTFRFFDPNFILLLYNLTLMSKHGIVHSLLPSRLLSQPRPMPALSGRFGDDVDNLAEEAATAVRLAGDILRLAFSKAAPANAERVLLMAALANSAILVSGPLSVVHWSTRAFSPGTSGPPCRSCLCRLRTVYIPGANQSA